MSDPNIDPVIDFDQFLSDHLDGCLAGDDLQTLNAELERNAGLRGQYECMLADQENLRELFQQSTSTASGLPIDFASKVAAEAVRQRAVQPSVIAASLNKPTFSNRTAVVGIIATAAAALLVATLASRNGSESELAQNGPQSLAGPINTLDPANTTEPADTTGLVEALQGPETPDPEMRGPQLADNTSPLRSSEAATVGPKRVAIDAAENQIASSAPVDRVARSIPARKSNDVGMPLGNSAAVSIGSQPNDDAMSGAVLVYNVRLTTQGRVTQCVAKTMKKVGMPETSRQPIDGEVVTAAKSVDSFDEDSKFQLLYLRAPAKQLDRLFANLLQDRENVTSLGLTLVTNSPILKVTDNLQSVDPTLIQHEPGTASFELESDDAGELAILRRLLDDQTFLPLTPGVSATTGLNAMKPNLPSGSGQDVMSRVLLIVR